MGLFRKLDFTHVAQIQACGGNAAPVTKDGVFYCTNQHTLEVLTAPKLGAPFVHFSDINITLPNGTTVRYSIQ